MRPPREPYSVWTRPEGSPGKFLEAKRNGGRFGEPLPLWRRALQALAPTRKDTP